MKKLNSLDKCLNNNDKASGDDVMGITDALVSLIFCGLLGMVGQSIRVMVGVKKEIVLHENDSKINYSWFHWSELLVSLMISFPIGVLVGIAFGAMFAQPVNGIANFVIAYPLNMLSIIASGYAGTDFIEGFMNKYVPKTA